MSNYSLEAVATRVDDMVSNPQRNVSILVQNETQLGDASGLVQNIAPDFNGFCAVQFSDTGSDNAAGQNDRTIDAASMVNIANNTITVSGHGFKENNIARLKLPISGGGTVPSSFVIGQDYYVKVVDDDTIQLRATSAGSVINITDTGSGVFLVSRDLMVAFDAGDWMTTGTDSIYVVCVNYEFQYWTDAYKWFVKYSGCVNMITQANNTGNNVWCSWNRTNERLVPSIGGGIQFQPLAKFLLFGHLESKDSAFLNDGNKRRGATTNFTFTTTAGYGYNYTLMGCRIKMHVSNTLGDVGNLLWIRFCNSIKMYDACFDFFPRHDNFVFNSLWTFGGAAITSLQNIFNVIWSSQSLPSLASNYYSLSSNTFNTASYYLNGAECFFMQSHYFGNYGLSHSNWAANGGAMILGAPSNYAYFWQAYSYLPVAEYRRRHGAHISETYAGTSFIKANTTTPTTDGYTRTSPGFQNAF